VIGSNRIPKTVRLAPSSTAFTLLLSLLVALPAFGIDMSLPSFAATGAALGAAPEQVGQMMSLFMIGFGLAPLLYGPASDRFGRKPVVLFACVLFTTAGIGCALAQSLTALLAWRAVQGAGAGASLTIALAIIRDLFEGQAARTKLSYIAVSMMVVPMLAPTVGAAILDLAGWRAIHATLAVVGILLLLAIALGFDESAPADPRNRLVPSVVFRNYRRVLTQPVCLGYILANAAAFGSLFAYVSGSPLFFINGMRLGPSQYGLIFAATSLGLMGGAFVNGRLSARGASPDHPLTIGLAVGAVTAVLLLAMTLAGWTPLAVFLPVLVLATLSFGLVAPNAMQAAMQPLPEIAGAVGATAGCVQMIVGAISSGLVAALYDGRSALSMTALMALSALLALAFYLFLARPAERLVLQH
jgi:DHA1 family bicyclomycin/chloramphenicol resistance-like MFS transporter